mmetsp:Transcript_16138/g.34053  ORF Transcript_16138/g.34053 Transcript_16138/m.34053 type:complete len:517 (-) Transcript_16138:457-2007(-)
MMIPATAASTTMTTTMTTTPSSLKKRATAISTAEVPIFLQKAYHMIDTCDPKICCWSDDGLTFIVKNTSLFETTIIPQFFKHNKFSSFVRQLNFYGFRKVKFSNSLKIDHKLEAETAKFWRFRHDKFRRGRKDLLTEIKRTPSSSSSSSSSAAPSSAPGAKAPPSAVLSSSSVLPAAPRPNEKPEEVTHLKTEMQELKQRIASMTRNIDELTDMVKKVSVKEDEDWAASASASPVVSPGAGMSAPEGAGNKRKKLDDAPIPPIQPIPSPQRDAGMMDDLPIMPDWNPSSSDLGVDSLLMGGPLPDLAPSSAGSSSPIVAPSPTPSDEAFVDDLFQAFAGEGDAILSSMDLDEQDDAAVPPLQPLPPPNAPNAPSSECNDLGNTNKPDPKIMRRIEDSLSTLPRDMHEMVANKLIDAISASRPIADSVSHVEEMVKEERAADDASVIQTQAEILEEEEEAHAKPVVTSSIPLPLAVATLKTILSEYGVQVECRRTPCKDLADRTRFTKSLPVVPLHA